MMQPGQRRKRVNDSMSLCFTRTCLFTEVPRVRTERHQEFPPPAQSTLNGDSPRDTGSNGQGGHKLYTELKHTCFTPYRKRMETERWVGREREEEAEAEGGGGFGDLHSYSNTKEHVQIV